MPYNPGISYHGDQYIAQGNQAAFGALGQMLENMAEEGKRTEAAGKAADYYMKALGPDGFKGLGVDEQSFKNLGAKEKAAAVHGMVQAEATKSVVAQMADRRAQLELHRQAIGIQQRAADEAAGERDALTGFARDYTAEPGAVDFESMMTSPDFGAVDTGGTSLDRYRRALGANPRAAASAQFDNLLNALAKWDGAPKVRNEFSVDDLGKKLIPVPGTDRIAVPISKGSVELVQGPSIAAKKVMNPETGDLAGYSVDGKFVHKDDFEGVPANAQLEPVKDTEGKTVLGMLRDRKTGRIYKPPVNPFDLLQLFMGMGANGVAGAGAGAGVGDVYGTFNKATGKIDKPKPK